MLHTINKSPFNGKTLELFMEFAADREPLLLFEDGVYAAQAGTTYESEIRELLKTNPVFALQSDLKARSIQNLVEGIKVVDYDGFVDLVAGHKVQSWL